MKQIAAMFVAGCGGGYIIAALMNREGFRSLFLNSDVVGAALGAAVTILATMIIEDRRRTGALLEELRIVVESLCALYGAIEALAVPRPDHDELEVRVAVERFHYDSVIVALNAYEFSKTSLRMRTFDLYKAVTALDIEIARGKPRIRSEAAILEGQNVTMPVLLIARERLFAFADQIRDPLQEALVALGSSNTPIQTS